MGFLTDQAESRFRKLRRQSYIPPWMRLAQNAAIGLLAVLLSWSFISDLRSDGPPAGTDPPSRGGTSVPTAPTQSSVDTTKPPAGQVSVTHADGGAAAVPEDALAVANAGVRALFTTDFTTVRLASGTVLPTLPNAFPDPSLTEPRVLSSSSDLYRFDFVVDPDGGGAQPSRRVTGTAVRESGRWVFSL